MIFSTRKFLLMNTIGAKPSALSGFHLGFSPRGGANMIIVELRGGDDTLSI